MDKKSSILIVEDHALTSFALKTSITQTDIASVVYEADSAENAYKILEENDIDLIIMDLGLGEVDGIKAIKKIRSEKELVKIIVLTSHSDKSDVKACLKEGVSAYCTKDIKPDKLISVIKDVIDGSMYFDSSISKYVIEENSKQNENVNTICVKDCYNLTQQEKRVLILLASGNSNQQIAKKLEISVNTTKVHVCSILQKMQVEDRTQAAIKAIKENIIS